MNTTLVLNRNYVLTTTMGHSIQFVKDVPINVPPSVYQAALAIGAQPPDGTAPNVLAEVDPTKPPTDAALRNPLILAAIEKIVASNERKDFTAAGSPTVKAIEKILGWDVDGREIAVMWQEFHDKKAAQ